MAGFYSVCQSLVQQPPHPNHDVRPSRLVWGRLVEKTHDAAPERWRKTKSALWLIGTVGAPGGCGRVNCYFLPELPKYRTVESKGERRAVKEGLS